MARKLLAGAAIGVLLAIGVGCGEESGVAAGATVTAYVDAPLCAGAERELARQGGRAGEVEVRVVCLASAGDGTRVDLAAVGANARRASEDSSSVGYIEEAATPSFSRPIVESAGIAAIRGSSGQAGMARLLGAIRDAGDSGALRESVREALG